MKITLWFRKLKDADYEFNHIENDWINHNHPTPKFPAQSAWKNSSWKKEHAYLIDGKIVRENI